MSPPRLDCHTSASNSSGHSSPFSGIIAVVLLIACSNVADLLLARGAARRREMALRASIGAGRGRLLQQVLVESSLLTLLASALGVLCATLAVPLIVGMLTTNENPVYLDAGIDWRVLMFVAALGGLTTVLFGLAPALRASVAMPGEVIALGNRRHTAHAGVARSLVAAQIAFSLMILFVAGLLLRSFDRLLAVDLGFTPDRVVLLSVEARDPLEGDKARAVGRQLLERAQSLPGVESASLSGWAPFRGWSWGNDVDVPGRGSSPTFRLAVSPQFFQTMRTRIIDGREFRPGENDTSDPIPVVVNDTFARKYFPGEGAVGRRMTTTRSGQTLDLRNRRRCGRHTGWLVAWSDESVPFHADRRRRGHAGGEVISRSAQSGGSSAERAAARPSVAQAG